MVKKDLINKESSNKEISNEIQINIIKAGDNKTYPQKGKKVTVLYTGTLENGK